MPDTRAKLLARYWLQMTEAEAGEAEALREKFLSGHEHRSTAKGELTALFQTIVARDPQPEHVPADPQP